jgi:hypothetical protein
LPTRTLLSLLLMLLAISAPAWSGEPADTQSAAAASISLKIRPHVEVTVQDNKLCLQIWGYDNYEIDSDTAYPTNAKADFETKPSCQQSDAITYTLPDHFAGNQSQSITLTLSVE